jgi:hypothetical protein
MNARIPLIIVASLVSTAAYASDSMRCGNRLITDGDPKAKVVELCGEPTQAESRTVLRSGVPRRYIDDNGRYSQTVTDAELLIHDRSLVEVRVDIWVYNRGRSNLLRELVFHDNRLVAVKILGRGY